MVRELCPAACGPQVSVCIYKEVASDETHGSMINILAFLKWRKIKRQQHLLLDGSFLGFAIGSQWRRSQKSGSTMKNSLSRRARSCNRAIEQHFLLPVFAACSASAEVIVVSVSNCNIQTGERFLYRMSRNWLARAEINVSRSLNPRNKVLTSL